VHWDLERKKRLCLEGKEGEKRRIASPKLLERNLEQSRCRVVLSKTAEKNFGKTDSKWKKKGAINVLNWKISRLPVLPRKNALEMTPSVSIARYVGGSPKKVV